MSRFLIRATLIFIFLSTATLLLGQPGDPGGDPDVPITGIEILLALGGLLGAKKIYDARKKKG